MPVDVAKSWVLAPVKMVLSGPAKTTGKGFTFIVRELETTGKVVHALLLVNEQVTTSLGDNVPVAKVVLFVPTFDPFTFHW